MRDNNIVDVLFKLFIDNVAFVDDDIKSLNK